MFAIAVPCPRPGSGFTLLFEAYVILMVQQMPVSSVGRLVGEYDTRLWRLLHHYVDSAREQVDMSATVRVGMDETSRTNYQGRLVPLHLRTTPVSI